MIIQCEQCRTKFRLDDEKVSDRGVKVRCAKCRHVFTVRKAAEQTEAAAVAAPVATFDLPEESDQPTTASEPESTIAFDFGSAPVEAPGTAADTSFDLAQTDAAAGSTFDFGDVSFGSEASATPAEADFGDMTMVMPPPKTTEPARDFNLDFGTPAVQAPDTPASDDAGFDFGEALADSTDDTVRKVEFDFGEQQTSSAASAADVDLGGFDFGEATGVAINPASGLDSTDLSDFAATVAPSAADHGFSFDDAVPQVTTAPADSFDFSGVDFGPATPAASSPASTEVEAFSLGDMDFSGDTSAVAVATPETSPAGALFAPVEEKVAKQQITAAPDITFDTPPPSEEAPPLAITSRRRQNSTISLALGVIAVVLVGVLGYLAVSILGKTAVPVDDGRITVQNVKAYYVPQAAAGELLVITGEALNNHKKPRAALQVKGMVFGDGNQTLANKTAYAGNPLSQEQLASMTADKIEAAMNNQFGDSLANLEVQPGKTIPFTIVIINPPKEGKDFGVEPVGSTVATSK